MLFIDIFLNTRVFPMKGKSITIMKALIKAQCTLVLKKFEWFLNSIDIQTIECLAKCLFFIPCPLNTSIASHLHLNYVQSVKVFTYLFSTFMDVLFSHTISHMMTGIRGPVGHYLPTNILLAFCDCIQKNSKFNEKRKKTFSE